VPKFSDCVAVAESVDDWQDLTYILCNKAHSQFVSDKGDIVGKKLKELKDVDLGASIKFIALCKGKHS
jgi:hypothetical protein